MHNNGIIISLDNHQTFERIFDKYAPALTFFATRLLGNSQDAEDIVSETFIKLWQSRYGFQFETQVKAFLYITTRNACFNAIKKASSALKQHNTYCAWSDKSEDYWLNQMVKAEVLREILQMLERLPPECRKIMRFRLAGKENGEIAQELNISIHTVKNQIARATYLIRKRIRTHAILIAIIIPDYCNQFIKHAFTYILNTII